MTYWFCIKAIVLCSFVLALYIIEAEANGYPQPQHKGKTASGTASNRGRRHKFRSRSKRDTGFEEIIFAGIGTESRTKHWNRLDYYTKPYVSQQIIYKYGENRDQSYGHEYDWKVWSLRDPFPAWTRPEGFGSQYFWPGTRPGGSKPEKAPEGISNVDGNGNYDHAHKANLQES